jgi:phosphate/sulfate permease
MIMTGLASYAYGYNNGMNIIGVINHILVGFKAQY